MFGILQHISENLNNVEVYRCKSGAYDLTGKEWIKRMAGFITQ